jgi:antimicrobial peptide system SdpB family protein
MLSKLRTGLQIEIDRGIAGLTGYSIFTRWLGVGRSLLASSLLLTLLFNSEGTLFFPMGVRQFVFSNLPSHSAYFNLFLLFGIKGLLISRIIAILILVTVIIGWRPRITCWLHAWVNVSFINAVVNIEGGDQILSNISLLLIPVCCWDRRRSHWSRVSLEYSPPALLVSNFFYLLIRLQVCIIYFVSCTAKFAIPEWKDGTALYYWLNDPIFGSSLVMRMVGLNKLLTTGMGVGLLTWGSLLIEILLFFGIATNRRYRPFLLVLGVSFHFFIFIFQGLFTFFITMTGALWFYLKDLRDNPYSR